MLTKVLPVEIRGRATGFQRMIENLELATTSITVDLLYTGLSPANSLFAPGLVGLVAVAYAVYVYRNVAK